MQSRETWKRFSAYYDSYTKGFAADLAFYGRAATARDRVLEVGCGSGRILQYLLDSGHVVTGVDISDEMLAVARSRLGAYLDKGTLKLVNHDFGHGPLQGSFTLGLVSYFTFNYVLEHPERFLENLAASLFAHHTLLIDLFYPKCLQNPDMAGQWVRDSMRHNGKTVPYSEKRSWNPHKEIEERIQIFEEDGHKNEITSLRRYYSPARIGGFLAKAGYADVAFCRGYDSLWVDSLPEGSLAGNFVVRAKR
jgi:SAM-dependent methyltransferase